MGETTNSRGYSSHIAGCVIKVDKDLRADEGRTLEDLKNYCNLHKEDLFTARVSEDITDFSSFFKALHQLAIINPHDISFVEEALRSVQRIDLSRAFEEARTQGGLVNPPTGNAPMAQLRVVKTEPIAPPPVMPPTHDTVGEDLTTCFDVCIEHIGRDWRFLGRRLQMSEFELDGITEKHPRNLREQVSTMLYAWKARYSQKATKAKLVEALRRCKMMLAADLVESVQTG